MKVFVVVFRWGEVPASYDRVHVEVVRGNDLSQALTNAMTFAPINSKVVGVFHV